MRILIAWFILFTSILFVILIYDFRDSIKTDVVEDFDFKKTFKLYTGVGADLSFISKLNFKTFTMLITTINGWYFGGADIHCKLHGSDLAPLPLLYELSDRIKIKTLTPPKYPLLSRKNREEGVVYILVKLSKSGDVENAKIIESSGYNNLDSAALNAVKRWEFDKVCKEVDLNKIKFVVPVVFKLKKY